jgi:hypothetical protein
MCIFFLLKGISFAACVENVELRYVQLVEEYKKIEEIEI